MIKRAFIVTLLTAMLVSSCSAQATAEPATLTATIALTDTAAPTDTQVAVTDTPAMTDTATSEGKSPAPTITGTAQTPQPANDPNCTNRASFVADITIPDNTDISAGAPFTKTWRVSNTGTCIWGSGYTLTYYSEERLGFIAPVPLPITNPGENADISVNLTAPNSTGKHRGNFVIKNPAGLIMSVGDDSRLWLVINVTSDIANATAAPAPTAATAAGLVTATCAFTADASTITDTINAINAYRLQKGFPPYIVNAQLSRAAQSHANDMACNNLTGHNGSNGSTTESRIRDSGYVFTVVGENIYRSNPPLTGQAVVNAWVADSTDLRNNLNMISDSYLDMGVGYSFFNGFGYFVIDFGTP